MFVMETIKATHKITGDTKEGLMFQLTETGACVLAKDELNTEFIAQRVYDKYPKIEMVGGITGGTAEAVGAMLVTSIIGSAACHDETTIEDIHDICAKITKTLED